MDKRFISVIGPVPGQPDFRLGFSSCFRSVWFKALPLAVVVGVLGEVVVPWPSLAQSYPLPPVPSSYGDTVPAVPSSSYQSVPQVPPSGNQFVVYVPGSNPQLLDQVKRVEPTAFQTTIQGTTVIQAGRFSIYQNAQQRVNDLAIQGVGATIAEVEAAVPYYAQTPAPPANVYASTGNLPPLPTTPVASTGSIPTAPMATPSAPTTSGSVEFGQQLSYSVPPNPNAYPVNIPPPTSAQPVAAVTSSSDAPFYVVIPTNERDLPLVSSQVIQLGTPPNQVQQRTSPLGPHVAIGPFADRGLAEEWTSFYREAGFSSSRVFFQR